jgi:hypothetical protein
MKKLLLTLAAMALVMSVPVLLNAQYGSPQQDNMGSNMGKQMSVTGCLKQGTDTGGYYLMGDDGKMYELWGKGLSAHVNHKVTVTGMQETMPDTMEKKRETAEKSEAGGATTVDMKVSQVKMISESCQ